MMDERNHLVKKVFPELRKLCQSRGVELTEIDLRWGVSEKQSQEGKVIEICLQEIDRCRPYFIGLLGERYGWTPNRDEQTKHERACEIFPWIKHDFEEKLSITEIEIQYGVLRHPDKVTQAFFYLRHPDSSPAEFRETKGSTKEQKLSKLKTVIQNQNTFPHHEYHDLDELEKQINKDFSDFIDAEYPEEQTPSNLERAQIDHAAFALNRLKVYIGGHQYINRLDQHVDSNDKPLVVTGESGLGKSALLANWIAHYQKNHPDEFVFYHFIGGAPDSSDHTALMRRIMLEMQAQFGIEDEVPSDPVQIIEMFPKYLTKTLHLNKWVLVLDALDQLEDKNNARWLGWLPELIPDNIRVIVSTLPGESLEALQKRHCPEMTIKVLSVEQRKILINDYLGLYTKELSDEFVNHIVHNPITDSPLILRTILDELRIFGEHESLQARINYYLAAQLPIDFFDAVLKRLEDDYEKYHSGMVGEILSLIWASRHGLAETEILEITGIPALYWTPLYNVIENHLVSKSGILDFFHDYLRQAVKIRYIHNEQHQKKLHIKLAKYFKQQDITQRRLDEEIWHYAETQSWKEMYKSLTDTNLLSELLIKCPYDIRKYWQILLANTQYEPDNAYRDYLDSKKILSFELNFRLAELTKDIGYLQFSLSLYKKLNNSCDSHPIYASELYNRIAQIYYIIGDYKKSLESYNAALKNYNLTNDKNGISHIKSNLANEKNGISHINSNIGLIEYDRGEYKKALISFENAESEARKRHSNWSNVGASLLNQSNVHIQLGQFKKAIELIEKAKNIYAQSSDLDGIQTALGNLAGMYINSGDYLSAEPLLEEQLDICRRLALPDGLQRALGNLAIIKEAHKQIDIALELLKEKEIICRKNNYTESLCNCLGAQANIHVNKKEYDLALQMYSSTETIQRELGLSDGLQKALGNKVNTLIATGKIDEANLCSDEQIEIGLKTGNVNALVYGKLGKSRILLINHEDDKATVLLDEVHHISKKHGLNSVLQLEAELRGFMLQTTQKKYNTELDAAKRANKMAGEAFQNGDFVQVLKWLNQELEVFRVLKDKEKMEKNLSFQIDIIRDNFTTNEAIQHIRKNEQLVTALNSPKLLAEMYTSLAYLYSILDNNYESIVYCIFYSNNALNLKEYLSGPLSICSIKRHKATAYGKISACKLALNLEREIEKELRSEIFSDDYNATISLLYSIGNQAKFLMPTGNLPEAKNKLDELLKLCQKHNFSQGIEIHKSTLRDYNRYNEFDTEEFMGHVLNSYRGLIDRLAELSEVAINLEKYEIALDILSNVENMYFEYLPDHYFNYGGVLLHQASILTNIYNNYEAAIDKINLAHELALKSKDQELISAVNDLMANIKNQLN